MPGLEIKFFGGVDVTADGHPVELPSRRAAWLLAALSLRQGRSIDRRELSGVLWPESTDERALHNLRQTLALVRKALGKYGEVVQASTARSLILPLDPRIELDFAEFLRETASSDVYDWKLAVGRYRGPFLPDCDEPFAIREREVTERAFLDLANRLATHYLETKQYPAGIELLQRVLEIDCYQEGATRTLMQCLAESGETAKALEAYRRLTRHLRRDLQAEPGGETKALSRTLRDSASRRRPVQRQPSGMDRSLPRPLTSLIGRDADLREIADLLSRSKLVTIVGFGGVGKTRLALAAAEQYEEEQLETAALVDLSPAKSGSAILELIGQTMGAPTFSGASAHDSLLRWLREQPGLIVLDNCEHLVDTVAPALESLLQSGGSIQVLATSRKPIGLSGEMIWWAKPLETPSAEATIEECEASAAVRLFVERASAIGGHGEWEESELLCVGSICRRLDGVPLAIEFAAARVPLLSVREIEENLEDRFELLRSTGQAPPRHQTLRATLDWSWELLAPPERRLLECLAVFPGGADRKTIEAVFKKPVLDLLSNLVNQSFVVARRQGGASRYVLLETVREYAMEKLEASGRASEHHNAHAAYFYEWVIAGEENYYTPTQSEWFEKQERDHENIRAAIEWLREQGERERELRFATAMCRFWDTCGRLKEGRVFLESALRDPDRLPKDLVARGRACAGWMAIISRDAETAIHHYLAVLDQALEDGDPKGLAGVHSSLAAACYGAGRYSQAQMHFEKAISLYREHGLRQGAATLLANMSEMALLLNDVEKARRYLEESLQEIDGMDENNPERTAIIYVNMAVVDLRQGRTEDAIRHGLYSLKLFFENKFLVSIPDAIAVLALVEGVCGRWDRVARLLAACQRLTYSMGVPLSEIIARDAEELAAKARGALGEEPFNTYSRDGEALSLDEAVALAREIEELVALDNPRSMR